MTSSRTNLRFKSMTRRTLLGYAGAAGVLTAIPSIFHSMPAFGQTEPLPQGSGDPGRRMLIRGGADIQGWGGVRSSRSCTVRDGSIVWRKRLSSCPCPVYRTFIREPRSSTIASIRTTEKYVHFGRLTANFSRAPVTWNDGCMPTPSSD